MKFRIGPVFAFFLLLAMHLEPASAASSEACDTIASNAFTACFYKDISLTKLAHVRTDAKVDFDWGSGAPATGVKGDLFSAVWKGRFDLAAGTYRFTVKADDGVRLYVDGVRIVDDWSVHGETTYTANVDLAAGSHLIRLEYYENYGLAVAKLAFAKTGDAAVPTTPAPSQPTTCDAIATDAFTACLYNDMSMQKLAAVRTDPRIDFDWGSGAPASGVNSDRFSIVWKGRFNLAAGAYRFTMTGDDGVRLYVDDRQVLDGWFDQGPTKYTATLDLAAGSHVIRMEYYEFRGNAVARLSFDRADGSAPVTPPPAPPPATPTPPAAVSCNTLADNAFTACYFDDKNFSRLAATGSVKAIDFDWSDRSPSSAIGNDEFSATWRGRFTLEAGIYEFTAIADDGVRVFVDDSQILEGWKVQGPTAYVAKVPLAAGAHVIRMEYYENFGNAVARLKFPKVANLPASGSTTSPPAPKPPEPSEPPATPPKTYSATLAWTPPSLRVDSSPLTDLAGYVVYMGSSAASLSAIATIQDGSAVRHVIPGLQAGTYFFALQAFDTMGARSEVSQVASRTF